MNLLEESQYRQMGCFVCRWAGYAVTLFPFNHDYVPQRINATQWNLGRWFVYIKVDNDWFAARNVKPPFETKTSVDLCYAHFTNMWRQSELAAAAEIAQQEAFFQWLERVEQYD
jgi:hypothetical protein